MPPIAATHERQYNRVPSLPPCAYLAGRTMTDPSSPGSPSTDERPADDRLDSWKEIAAYMKRDVTTVQRWERRDGMPVYRHLRETVLQATKCAA